MLKFASGLFIGLMISAAAAAAAAQVVVTCGQGQLAGYVVQDTNGNEVCKDPFVFNDFKSQGNFVVCE